MDDTDGSGPSMDPVGSGRRPDMGLDDRGGFASDPAQGYGPNGGFGGGYGASHGGPWATSHGGPPSWLMGSLYTGNSFNQDGERGFNGGAGSSFAGGDRGYGGAFGDKGYVSYPISYLVSYPVSYPLSTPMDRGFSVNAASRSFGSFQTERNTTVERPINNQPTQTERKMTVELPINNQPTQTEKFGAADGGMEDPSSGKSGSSKNTDDSCYFWSKTGEKISRENCATWTKAWYICDVCGKRMPRHYFFTHYRKHTGDKPFQCKYCDLIFPTRSEAFDHQREMHQGETPIRRKFRRRNRTPKQFRDGTPLEKRLELARIRNALK